jgi:5-methylcytosine-specific restriction endonuclease McrA
MRVPALAHVSDQALLQALGVLVARDRSTTAELLEHLGEVNDRRLYASAGYPSMFDYCVEELRFSESVAYNRIYVARAARRFPRILEAVAAGRLHLTAVRLIVPYLTEENVEELLTAASTCLRKSELELLLATRFPRSGDGGSATPAMTDHGEPSLALFGEQHVPEQVQSEHELCHATLDPDAQSTAEVEEGRSSPIPPWAPLESSAPSESWAPLDSVPPSTQLGASNPKAPAPVLPGPVKRSLLGASEPRFHLHLRLDRQTHERFLYAQALLSHAIPSGHLELVLARALDALIPQLLRRKFGVTKKRSAGRRDPDADRASSVSRPSKARGLPNPGERRARAASARRAIPARVRHAVWKRDQGRCTYVGVNGRRCRTRRLLEFDHARPVALGGGSTVDELRLRCRAHNQFEAERTFGRAFMRMKRALARGNASSGAVRPADRNPQGKTQVETRNPAP